jgi:hypothetical protein
MEGQCPYRDQRCCSTSGHGRRFKVNTSNLSGMLVCPLKIFAFPSAYAVIYLLSLRRLRND